MPAADGQPTGVGPVYMEYSIQQVGRRLGVSRVRDNPKPSDCLRHDLRLTHQLGNRVSAAHNTLSRKLSMDVRCTIRVSACGVNCPDVRGQPRLPFTACARRPTAGGIVTARRDLERLAQRLNGIAVSIGIDERVLRADSRAK